jgi:RNA polymerase-binding protein DksA
MAKPKPKKSSSKVRPAGKTRKPSPRPPSRAPKKPGAARASARKKPAAAPKPLPKAATKAPPPAPPEKPAGRKGITVVQPKIAPKKPRPKPKSTALSDLAKVTGQLLPPGGPARKPLIASGPRAAKGVPLGSHTPGQEPPPLNLEGKTPLSKAELERFRALLLKKRAELVGDVANMEAEALQSTSGGLSHTPQHLAEQGSDAYDQSLALDLAAADRKLIKEIDDALARIDKGTFGLCELTGKPIPLQRLEELPWARFSIEAARQLERRGVRI